MPKLNHILLSVIQQLIKDFLALFLYSNSIYISIEKILRKTSNDYNIWVLFEF